MGAYGYALALLGALHHRDRTGQGQWIDASQCESGLFMTGIPVLDWSANGRVWSRIGNRSPYKPAAPHGAYRCEGRDSWLAIACFDQASGGRWRRSPALDDARFATLEQRLAQPEALDAAVTAWTRTQDARDAMARLQDAGVPAGVCQTAADRCDRDPQLAALHWLTEVTGTKIGHLAGGRAADAAEPHARPCRRPDQPRRPPATVRITPTSCRPCWGCRRTRSPRSHGRT